VQTFYTVRVEESAILQMLNIDDLSDPSDRLRFGISGLIGGASFSVAIEYGPAEIIVIPNRSALTAYQGFWNVQDNASKWLKDQEFQKMFHYRPEKALTLVEHVANFRSSAS